MFYSRTVEIFLTPCHRNLLSCLALWPREFILGSARRSVWVKKSMGMMNHQHYKQSWDGRAHRSWTVSWKHQTLGEPVQKDWSWSFITHRYSQSFDFLKLFTAKCFHHLPPNLVLASWIMSRTQIPPLVPNPMIGIIPDQPTYTSNIFKLNSSVPCFLTVSI